MAASIALPSELAATLAQLRDKLQALPTLRRLGDDDAEAVYAVGYREFGQGRYEQALRHFQLLLVYRPTHTVYLLGAALCLQRLRRFELAIVAFTALRFLEPAQPGHLLAAAECHLLCGERGEAGKALRQLVAWCREHGGHAAVLARAEALLTLMQSRTGDQP